MPHTTYALFGAIRTHQIESPHIRSSARFGIPNACNLCHLDQPLSWTQKHLVERYQQEAITLTEEQNQYSAALLWLLKGHAAQRVITAWHMSWPPAVAASGNQWQGPFLAQLLDDPYGVVRYVTGKALEKLPGFADLSYDFLANSRERNAVRVQAMKQWENGQSRRSSLPGATLQTPDGELLRAELAAFLSQRDDRPITIKE